MGPSTSKYLVASGYVVDADTTTMIDAIEIRSSSGAASYEIQEGSGGTVRWVGECTTGASTPVSFPKGLVVKGAYVSITGSGVVSVAYR